MEVKFSMRPFSFAILAFALVAVPSAQEITSEQKTTVLAGVSEVIAKRAFVPGVDFASWPKFVEAQRNQIEKAKTVPQFAAAVNQALRKFGFSHINLQTPRQAERRTQTTAIGIGVSVQASAKGLVVRGVSEGSPASKAGVVAGDFIVLVDGKKPSDISSVTGDAGKKIAVEIIKSTGERVKLAIEFQSYAVTRKDTLTLLADRKALLKIHSFSTGYDRKMMERLVKEAGEKSTAMIIDLRSNGGGARNNLIHFLSLMLPDKTEFGVYVNRALADQFKEAYPEVTCTADAVAKWSPTRAKTAALAGVKPYGGKIAVLINGGSASASEIAALALRENVGAKLVGSKSRGAVLSSNFAKLEGGFQIQFPISDYVSTKWVRIEGNPLVPDIEISGPIADGVDPVIARAFEAIMPVSGTKPVN